jgi:peptidoglycan/xylan/chitin deacetylase (PgdA/CDA1 family)
MTAVNKMPLSEKLINFGCTIGMPDSNAVSFLNCCTVKPINWMRGSDGTHKAAQFIWREIIARVWAVTASAFASLTAIYHLAAAVGKTPLALLKAAGVKQIPSTFSFRAIGDNLQNAGQALVLTVTGTFIGIIRPDKLAEFAYPISERNKVPVFGYHEVSNEIGDAWTVSPDTFRQHLKHLYEHHYELCTLAEFTSGYQPSEGKKLAVITFDDSHESQFRMTDDTHIDPNCAVGIMESFQLLHPDFRCKATFFVNTGEAAGSCGSKRHRLFAKDESQDTFTETKLNILKRSGFEIAAHGHLHQRFDQMSKEEIEADIQEFDKSIEDLGIDFKPEAITSFAWPHGLSPKKEVRQAIDERFSTVADFGFHAGKESPERKDVKRIRRLFIGPNTGFKQYAP